MAVVAPVLVHICNSCMWPRRISLHLWPACRWRAAVHIDRWRRGRRARLWGCARADLRAQAAHCRRNQARLRPAHHHHCKVRGRESPRSAQAPAYKCVHLFCTALGASRMQASTAPVTVKLNSRITLPQPSVVHGLFISQGQRRARGHGAEPEQAGGARREAGPPE